MGLRPAAVITPQHLPPAVVEKLVKESNVVNLFRPSASEVKPTSQHVHASIRAAAEGHTFVSRTSIDDTKHGRRLTALRVVIGNPLTEEKDIDDVIADQLRILNEQKPAAAATPSKVEELGEEYWCQYWRKMPDAAKQFYMNDAARFGKLAPVA